MPHCTKSQHSFCAAISFDASVKCLTRRQLRRPNLDFHAMVPPVFAGTNRVRVDGQMPPDVAFLSAEP
jgi:hypothetical protein